MSMELVTVENVVAALVALYEATWDDYTQWQRCVRQDNHYRTRDRGRSQTSSPPPGGGCALSTSLRYSAARIRDTFANGTEVLGHDFAAGDKPCFRLLLDNLGRLEARFDGLRRHVLAGPSSNSSSRPRAPPLELRETLRASEAVRAATLRALSEQYHRVAVGRLASPRPVLRPATPQPAAAARRPGQPDDDDDDDGRTTTTTTTTTNTTAPDEEEEDEKEVPSAVCRLSARAPDRPTPPSPPPTPTRPLSSPPPPPPPPADDAQSTCTTGTGPRPRASVFSLFCPEAVKYQVDLTRPTPRGPCRRCGYAWEQQQQQRGLFSPPPPPPPPLPLSPLSPSFASTTTTTTTTMLKEGFQLTPRFLGKSHCRGADDDDDDNKNDGDDGGFFFACVLCTSRGASALYASVAALRDHINLAHDKWQMLHERDLVAR